MKRLLPVLTVLLLAGPRAGADLLDDGFARLRAGDDETAARDLAAFAEQNPKDKKASRALFTAGDINEGLDRVPEAIVIYQRVADGYGNDPWALKALDRLAKLHRERREWDDAVVFLARFVEVYLAVRRDTVDSPTVQDALDRIVDCRLEEDSSRTRDDALREILERYPEHPLREAVIAAGGSRLLPPGSNLLQNPGFEWDGEGQRLPPVGWEYLGTEPDPGDDADGTLNAHVYDVSEPRSGEFCAGKFTSYGTHRGWFFQTITAEPGKEYECFAFGRVRGEEGGTGRLRVGVDPSGAANPLGTSVLWSDYVSPLEEYVRIGFVGDEAIRAVGANLTIFLEMRQDDIRPDNAMLFDDACVRASVK